MEQLFEFIGNHYILTGIFVVLMGIFARNELQRGGRAVSAQQLVDLINREGAVVLDVRDKNEFGEGHIVDALNIPHTAIAGRIGELERHKVKPVVVACKMGQHSRAVGTVLRKAGFENVARLRGGITEWRSQNLPVIKGS